MLGLIINHLYHQPRTAYAASIQGFGHEGFSVLFHKTLKSQVTLSHFNECSVSNTVEDLWNIKGRKKVTQSLQSIGFNSNVYLYMTVKNIVLQVAACGWYKKKCSLSTSVDFWSAQKCVHPMLRTQKQFWPFYLELGISSVMDYLPTALFVFIYI